VSRRLAVCAAVLLLSAVTLQAATVELGFPAQPERMVTLPGRGAVTGARLYAPEGPGPFPSVVLSHTSGPLRQHVFEWAQKALAAGYVALIVDHLGPRRMASNFNFAVSVTEYAQDDVAAMRHLRTLAFVDRTRIAQMGFSYGAMAGLRAASKSFRDKHLGGEPLLVLVGADDDEANPQSCIAKAKENAAKGQPVELTIFPGTTHAFDHSWMGDKTVTAQQGNRTVTYRYNRASVDATWTLTLDFLARRLGGGK